MFDELTAGMDEILLARLEVGRIEIPVSSESELLQLRQKFYVRAKKIRSDCEKSGVYGKLYQAASTFTATPDKDNMMLIINDRSHIVGTSAIKNALAKIKKTNGEVIAEEIHTKSGNMLQDIRAAITKTEEKKVQSNPFYDREGD